MPNSSSDSSTDSSGTPADSSTDSSGTPADSSSGGWFSSETFTRILRIGLIALMAIVIATSLMEPTMPSGQTAPELFLRSYDGKVWNLKRFEGKPVVLNFWGSWCPPCMAELPSFVKAANDHPELQFVGATVGSDPSEVFATIRRFRIPYVIAEVDSQGTQAWGASTLPTTFFLDKNHKVVFSTRGQMSHKMLEHALNEHLLGKGDVAKTTD